MPQESDLGSGPGEMAKQRNTLEAIRYERGRLRLLDQKRLPHESVYVEIPDCDAAWRAIRDMVVRGAPAIAVTAALALAVEVTRLSEAYSGSAAEAAALVEQRLEHLVSSRPTAVNLAEAAAKLGKVARAATTAEGVFGSVVEAAEEMLAADVVANKAIGDAGAEALIVGTDSSERKSLAVLTHCNTGSLATAGYGTALGVIRSLHSRGRLRTAYCTETRPYNQGARLTAYELVHDAIPGVLVADSAAAALLAAGRVDAVVVGADRVAANGDTANKIGTLALAVAAAEFGVPFFVAAPVTTVDAATPSGRGIAIEERAAAELTHAKGGAGARVAADGIGVWNPAFDVTPARLIAAIITDEGVVWRDEKSDSIDIRGRFFPSIDHPLQEGNRTTNGISIATSIATFTTSIDTSNDTSNDTPNEDSRPIASSDPARDYSPLNEKDAVDYLARIPALAERLGGSSPREWDVREVGDGNLNFVYIVKGPKGSLVLKQALPYVRCVGESWPMTLERSFFEVTALKLHFSLAPGHVPEVYHFDHPMAAIAMRYLEPPHVILRKGLIDGTVYPHLADHISTFMARTLFHTSLLALSTLQYREAVAAACGNVEMCRLTEQVIFTEPYMVAANNHWTAPQLDGDARALREDGDLKVEIADLKAKFCGSSQALVHGDLHTGSVMVTATSTQVIDPEFSFYGPSGFDVGAFLGNLILAYFAQDGHARAPGERDAYKRWILQTITDTWTLFEEKFTAEWEKSGAVGDAYVAKVFDTAGLRAMAQKRYLAELFHDSLGFAGAKMIRRVVGIAHVEDLESIADPERRAVAERKVLEAAKVLVKQRRQFSSISQVVDFLSS